MKARLKAKGDDRPEPKGDDRPEPKGNRLIKMVRNSKEEPKTAEVHPDEVENYKQGGWTVAED